MAIYFQATRVFRLCLVTYVVKILSASRANITTGVELARAFADTDITEIILTDDICLKDEDWVALPTPLYIHRNLTVRGSASSVFSENATRTLDFRFVSAKVQLADGVILELHGMFMINYRLGNHNQGPGLDLLIASPPTASSVLRISNSVLVHRACYPAYIQAQSLQVYPRPQSIPGQQQGNATWPPPPQRCLNDTAAPPLERCWAHRGSYGDFAVPCADLDKYGKPILSRIVVHLVRTTYVCAVLMSESCVADMGALGCAFYTFANLDPPGLPGGAQPPLPTLSLSDTSITTPAAAAGGGHSRKPMLAAALGASLGGATLLVLSVVGVASSRTWRRRRCPQQSVLSGKGLDGGGGDGRHSSVSSTCPWGGAAAAVGGEPTGQEQRRERSLYDTATASSNSGGGGGDGSDGGQAEAETAETGDGTACMRARAAAAVAVELDLSRPLEQAAEVRALGPQGGASGQGGAGSGVVGVAAASAAASGPRSAAAAAPAFNAAGMVVVTPLTPHRPDVDLGQQLVLRNHSHAPPCPPPPPPCRHPGLPHPGGANPPGAATSATAGSAAKGGSDPMPPASHREPGAVAAAATAAQAEEEGHDPCEVVLLPVVRGRGSYGRVVEGTYRGQLVAVKLLAGGELLLDRGLGSSTAAAIGGGGGGGGGASQSVLGPLQALAQEVEVLGRCAHPNVVRLLAACVTPPQVCLVMELMDMSLEQLIRQAPGRLLPMKAVLGIALDIALGLEYLHPTVVHRDLKPANVLVNDPLGPRQVAKLSDFGLARLRSSVLITRTPEAGTPPYMAPECFDALVDGLTHHIDIYSLGVVLWVMLSGKQPWHGLNMVLLAYRVTQGGDRPPLSAIPPGRRPAKLLRLIQCCWEADPRRRPAAAEAAKMILLVREELAHGGFAAAGQPAINGSAPPRPSPLQPPEQPPSPSRRPYHHLHHQN